MLYQILFLWISIFTIIVHSDRTTLSKEQCPSHFYMSLANSTYVSASQAKSSVSFFYSLYDKQQNQKRVQNFVITGNTDDLNDYMSSFMVPYIIIAALVFAIFFTFNICCIFDKSCPPQSLRRDTVKSPYSSKQLIFITILTTLVSFGILITALLSLSYIKLLRQSITYTKCSMYVTLDVTLNGLADTNWGGFSNLIQKIGNVSVLLTNSLPAMTTYLSGNQWLRDTMQQMKQTNINIYENNKDAKLITPNPDTTATAINNGLSTPLIASQFILNGLGPNGTFGTMVDDIDRGLRTTEVLSAQGFSIQVSSQTLINSSSTIISNTQSSLSTLDMYIHQLQTFQQYLDSFSNKYFDYYFQFAIYFLQGVMGFFILGSFLILLSVFAVYGLQLYSCLTMARFGFILYGGLMTGIIGLIFVTLGMGSVGYSFCNYYDNMLHNRFSYNRIIDSYSQNIFNRLDVCIYGDGNVLQKFNLAQQMQTVTNLFSNIQKYFDYQNSFSSNFVDTSISVGKINGWIGAMSNYKQGIYKDSPDNQLNNDNPNYAITQLNLFTNGGGGVPTCATDVWTFDATNCTNSSQQTYVSNSLQSNGLNLIPPPGKAGFCISFNQKLSTAQSSSWTQSDFTRRYTQTRQNCPDAYNKTLYYGYTLINYRNSRINLFKGIQDSLSNLYIKNTNFNTNITNFKTTVQTFQSQVSELNNVVTNSLDGLLVSSDCRAIADTLRFTYNVFCVNSMYLIVKIGWYCIIVGVLAFFGLILTYYFADWFQQVQKKYMRQTMKELPSSSVSQKDFKFDFDFTFDNKIGGKGKSKDPKYSISQRYLNKKQKLELGQIQNQKHQKYLNEQTQNINQKQFQKEDISVQSQQDNPYV